MQNNAHIAKFRIQASWYRNVIDALFIAMQLTSDGQLAEHQTTNSKVLFESFVSHP